MIAVIEDNDYKIKVAQAKAKYEQALQNQKNAKANHSAMQTQIDIARADFERYKHSTLRITLKDTRIQHHIKGSTSYLNSYFLPFLGYVNRFMVVLN